MSEMYCKLEELFFEYCNVNSNDNKNFISQNISPGDCCFWYCCNKKNRSDG